MFEMVMVLVGGFFMMVGFLLSHKPVDDDVVIAFLMLILAPLAFSIIIGLAGLAASGIGRIHGE